MKNFDYEVGINQLDVGKEIKLNNALQYILIPNWTQGNDFINLFLPYLKIIGDSREQDNWIEEACKYYGIAFEWAKKDKKNQTENLKEGDYSFSVHFKNKTYNYVGEVAFERKGSISEFYSNCTGYDKTTQKGDRERIKREFARFKKNKYKKIVLMLEFGNNIIDLINMEFRYRNSNGELVIKNTNKVIYSAVMSWKQPNNKDFDVIQSDSHRKLFWLFIQECYYYFRNEIRRECIDKNIIENIEGEIDYD